MRSGEGGVDPGRGGCLTWSRSAPGRYNCKEEFQIHDELLKAHYTLGRLSDATPEHYLVQVRSGPLLSSSIWPLPSCPPSSQALSLIFSGFPCCPQSLFHCLTPTSGVLVPFSLTAWFPRAHSFCPVEPLLFFIHLSPA